MDYDVPKTWNGPALEMALGEVAKSTIIMSFSKNGTNFFDWPKIKECAALRIEYPDPKSPGANDMTSPEWRKYEANFLQITRCRLALAAPHEGWKASGTTEPNPYPPEPMIDERH